MAEIELGYERVNSSHQFWTVGSEEETDPQSVGQANFAARRAAYSDDPPIAVQQALPLLDFIYWTILADIRPYNRMNH